MVDTEASKSTIAATFISCLLIFEKKINNCLFLFLFSRTVGLMTEKKRKSVHSNKRRRGGWELRPPSPGEREAMKTRWATVS